MKSSFSFIGVALSVCIVVANFGCRGGILPMPAVERLDPEQQSTCDEMWSNMLSPPARLDRDVLLDTVMAFQLFQVGVNELQLTSTKQLGEWKVIMTINFRRDQPQADRFTICVADRGEKLVRREDYSFAEVRQRFDDMTETGSTLSETAPATVDTVQRHEQHLKQHQEELERRLARVMAATQPASRPAGKADRPASQELFLQRLVKPTVK